MRRSIRNLGASPRTPGAQFGAFRVGVGHRRATTPEFWRVRIVAHSPEPIDAHALRHVLEQSDLGGDMDRFAAGTKTITMVVSAIADSELKACRRVLARVKDTLGSGWTIDVQGGGQQLEVVSVAPQPVPVT